MRGKKAKSIRAAAGFKPGTTVTYGQHEAVKKVKRLTRQPGPFGTFKMVMKEFSQSVETGARICMGPRRIYKMLKGVAKRV